MSTVSAFWGDHQTSRAEAARTVSSTLEAMASLSPLLTGWRKKGRSGKQAMSHPPIGVSTASVKSLLRVNRTDIGNEAMPRLGFHFDVWNGAAEEHEQAAISVTIGSHAANPALRNSFVVDLPSSWTRDDVHVDRLAEVLADRLTPDEVVYIDNGHSEALWPLK